MRRPAALILFASSLLACGPKLTAPNPYERHLAAKSALSREALSKTLHDKDWRVAATASLAAEKARNRRAAGIVSDLLAAKTFTDDRVEYFLQLLAALGSVHERRILPLYIGHRRASVRIQVARALAPTKLGGPGAEPLLVRLLSDKDAEVRREVLAVLARYDSATAQVPLAVAKKDWVKALRLGGHREVLVVLRSVPPAEGRAILHAVAGLGATARPLYVAILNQSRLSALHLAAYTGLAGARAEKPMARYRQQTAATWRARLRDIVARCASKDWHLPMGELRRLAASPPFDFLEPLLADAKVRCRQSALIWVRKDLAGTPR